MLALSLVVAFAVAAISVTAQAKDAPLPKVMVINSYSWTYSWTYDHNEALVNALSSEAQIVIHDLNTKQLPFEKHEAAAQDAFELYLSEQPDIVVLTDDFALKALGNRIAKTGTQVVYLGINNNPRNYLDDLTQFTGVLERPVLRRSVARIQRLLDQRLEKCLVMFDNGITAQAIYANDFQNKDQVDVLGTNTHVALNRTFAEWKKAVLAARDNGHQAMILGLYHTLVDDDGNHVSDAEVARWTSENSPVPVFAFWNFAVGRGKAIGGLVLDGEPQGEEAARLVRRILAGESAGSIQPVTMRSLDFVFSESELKRWGLYQKAHPRPGESIYMVD